MIVEMNLSDLENINDDSIKEELLSLGSNNPFAKFIIYKNNENILGYLYYSDIYDRIEINELLVFNSYRRKGYASKMLECLINKNKDISLEVKCDNINAINLYEKYGFKKVAVRHGYYDGIDGNLMILEMK